MECPRNGRSHSKQRITHILIREVILDRDEVTNEAIVVIHWNGGRHTELRVSRDASRSPISLSTAIRTPWRPSRSSAGIGRIGRSQRR